MFVKLEGTIEANVQKMLNVVLSYYAAKTEIVGGIRFINASGNRAIDLSASVNSTDEFRIYCFGMDRTLNVNADRKNIELPKKIKFRDKELVLNNGQCTAFDIKKAIGYELKTDDKKHLLGTIYCNSVFIFFNLLSRDDDKNLITIETGIRAIMDALLEWNALPEAQKQINEADQIKAIFRNGFTQFADKNKNEIQQLIIKTEKEVTEIEKQLIQKQRTLQEARRSVEDVELTDEEIDMMIMEKYEDIKALERTNEKYESVKIGPGFIKAITSPVRITYDSKIYDLGKYEILLSVNGTVSIHSLAGHKNGYYDHPHITNNSLCSGNMNADLVRLMSEFQFDVVLNILRSSLEIYTAGDAYVKIDQWKECVV